MPKTPTDYSKTLIYKIVCNDLNIKDCYVGHTTNWIKRKSAHKTNCNNQNRKEHNHNVYKFIRQNGGWGNWEMIEIKKYPCNDKREAEAEERRYYEQLNSNLNTYRPFTTKDEKKEQRKDYDKNYNEKNKDKIKEINKNYNENNKDKKNAKNKCECGGKYTHSNISIHLKTKKHQNYINNLEENKNKDNNDNNQL